MAQAAAAFRGQSLDALEAERRFESQQFELTEAKRRAREERQATARIGEVTAELDSVIRDPSLDTYTKQAELGRLEMKYSRAIGKNDTYRALFTGARSAISPELAKEEDRMRVATAVAADLAALGDAKAVQRVLIPGTSTTKILKLQAKARERAEKRESDAKLAGVYAEEQIKSQAADVRRTQDAADSDRAYVRSIRPIATTDEMGAPIPGVQPGQLFDAPTRDNLRDVVRRWSGNEEVPLEELSDAVLQQKALELVRKRTPLPGSAPQKVDPAAFQSD
jgi:hypothetical protein